MKLNLHSKMMLNLVKIEGFPSLFKVLSIFMLTSLLYTFYGCIEPAEKKNNQDNDVQSEITDFFKIHSETIAEKTLKSTVSIILLSENSDNYQLGSGAVIDKGIIVTNYHVVSKANAGYVQLTDDKIKHTIDGIIAVDELNDLALISAPTIRDNKISIYSKTPKVGDKIFSAGNPEGLAGTFSEGIISSFRELDNRKLIQITAPISHGSSGGPIVNEDGELIGIAVGSIAQGQNLNFAIPTKFVIELLKKNNSYQP